MVRAIVPSSTVSSSKWFCARRRFVSFSGVAINWLNGQSFSTFHFIRDNRLLHRRGRIVIGERGKGRETKDNTWTETWGKEHTGAEIDFRRSILARTIDSTRNVFLSLCPNAFTDYGFVEFSFFHGPGKWGD